MTTSPLVWKPCTAFTSKVKSGKYLYVNTVTTTVRKNPFMSHCYNQISRNIHKILLKCIPLLTFLQGQTLVSPYRQLYLIIPMCTFSTSWFVSTGTSQIKLSKIFVMQVSKWRCSRFGNANRVKQIDLILERENAITEISYFNKICLFTQCLSSFSVIWALTSILAYFNRVYLISLIKKKKSENIFFLWNKAEKYQSH